MDHQIVPKISKVVIYRNVRMLAQKRKFPSLPPAVPCWLVCNAPYNLFFFSFFFVFIVFLFFFFFFFFFLFLFFFFFFFFFDALPTRTSFSPNFRYSTGTITCRMLVMETQTHSRRQELLGKSTQLFPILTRFYPSLTQTS